MIGVRNSMSIPEETRWYDYRKTLVGDLDDGRSPNTTLVAVVTIETELVAAMKSVIVQPKAHTPALDNKSASLLDDDAGARRLQIPSKHTFSNRAIISIKDNFRFSIVPI